MKKGFNQSLLSSLIPAQYDMVYNVGMKGTQLNPLFMERWKALEGWKRGIIHQPVLSTTENVFGNASAFHSLLNDLHYGDWNNDWPIIVDVWEAPANARYDLDAIRTHGIYITENYKPKLKPLLRVILSTWLSWATANPLETERLLQDYNILLCQPSVTKPNELDGIGIPAWWEYEFGMYANDPTLLYEGVVKPPVVVVPPLVPPVVPPEPEEPPVVVTNVTVPKKWKIKFLGGLITGTIEAEE